MTLPERFDDKPIYDTVVEVQLGSPDECASVGLKRTGLDACLADGRILHYDLEGRLVRVATPNVQWRRGLSHRVVQLRKKSPVKGGGLAATVLQERESDAVVADAAKQMGQVWSALQSDRFTLTRRGDKDRLPTLSEVVSRAAAFNVHAAKGDRDRFRKLYGDIPILPPDQYTSFVLLATDGCVYNQCTFCGFYRGVRYRMRNQDQFREHAEEAVSYHGAGLAARRGIFLGQANAFVGPRSWRESLLATVNDLFEFPKSEDVAARAYWWQGSEQRFQDVSSFLDVFTGARISVDEFTTMRKLQVRRLYLGIETGGHDLLSWLNKPATPQAMLATVRHIKEAGLYAGIIILLGAGGERFFNSHITETIQLLQSMPLQKGDYIYLSPLVEMPHAEYTHQALADQVEPLSPSRLAEQEQRIRAGLKFAARENRPYIATYDVSHFVY
jgi:radical SAM superfamily enzyme YgiQ (UPF0313 family)